MPADTGHGTILRMFFSLSLKRASWLVTFVGLGSFAVSFGALVVFAPDWAALVIPTIPATILTAVLAAIVAQFAMSLTGAVLTRHQSRENEQMCTAIDSMAQGLCMFDAAERLVVCNSQYYKMYELTSGDVIETAISAFRDHAEICCKSWQKAPV
jgi:PAS domain-containing protein